MRPCLLEPAAHRHSSFSTCSKLTCFAVSLEHPQFYSSSYSTLMLYLNATGTEITSSSNHNSLLSELAPTGSCSSLLRMQQRIPRCSVRSWSIKKLCLRYLLRQDLPGKLSSSTSIWANRVHINNAHRLTPFTKHGAADQNSHALLCTT